MTSRGSRSCPLAVRPSRAAAAIAFREKPAESHFGDGLPAASAELLQAKIKDLKLHLAGTPLERLIQQLYAELESKGLSLQPDCYLSDQWGCPSGVPVIGIPFYLADPKLHSIEEALALADRPALPAATTRSLIGGGTAKMLERGLLATGGPGRQHRRRNAQTDEGSDDQFHVPTGYASASADVTGAVAATRSRTRANAAARTRMRTSPRPTRNPLAARPSAGMARAPAAA